MDSNGKDENSLSIFFPLPFPPPPPLAIHQHVGRKKKKNKGKKYHDHLFFLFSVDFIQFESNEFIYKILMEKLFFISFCLISFHVFWYGNLREKNVDATGGSGDSASASGKICFFVHFFHVFFRGFI